MTYELALRLKEAGFPQEGQGVFVIYKHQSIGMSIKSLNDTMAYIPPLEEVIKECGERFECLYRICGKTVHETKEWHAHGFGSISGVGSTPLEAVVNLYIAINSK